MLNYRFTGRRKNGGSEIEFQVLAFNEDGDDDDNGKRTADDASRICHRMTFSRAHRRCRVCGPSHARLANDIFRLWIK